MPQVQVRGPPQRRPALACSPAVIRGGHARLAPGSRSGAGRDRGLPGALGDELTRLLPGHRPGAGGEGALANPGGHLEAGLRPPGMPDPSFFEPDACGEGAQLVVGVGEQVTPPAAHHPGAVRDIGAEAQVVDVHGHG
jgi:hypothetical protein